MYISARSNILEGEQLRFKGTWMRISRRACGTTISAGQTCWKRC